METLVPGQMLCARILLLPLLLCFGPDTAGSIDLTALKAIVDYVHPKYRPSTTQYAVAIFLPWSFCDGTHSRNLSLLDADLEAMKVKLSTSFLYEGDHIVAAKPNVPDDPDKPDKPDSSGQRFQHTEWLMLSLDQNDKSPVTRLLDKARGQNTCKETAALGEERGNNRYENWYPNNRCGWNGCFIFFTYYSPCVGVCLNLTDNKRIPQLMDGIFGAIDEDHRALVFKEVFTKDRGRGKQYVWNTWQTLCRVPIYQCDDQACHSCVEEDINKNYCLNEVRDASKEGGMGKALRWEENVS